MFLGAGDRLDKWLTGLAVGFSAAAPVAQAAAPIPAEFTPASLGAAVLFVAMTLGRMHFAQRRLEEDNRHRERLVQLEIDKILAQRTDVPPVPVKVTTVDGAHPRVEAATTPFDDPDRRD